MVWWIPLLIACGDPSQTAIVRPMGETTVLKIKGDAGRSLFDGLLGESVHETCNSRGCKRAGEHLLCSTMNLRDPVACEVRLGAEGGVEGAPEDLRLFHSASADRFYGTATLGDGGVVIEGRAAEELRSVLGWSADGPVCRGLPLLLAGARPRRGAGRPGLHPRLPAARPREQWTTGC